MKSRTLIVLAFTLLAVAGIAQKDSLKKWKLQSVSLDLQLLSVPVEQTTSQEKLREFVGNKDLLNKNLSSYSKGYGSYMSFSFPGVLSARASFHLSQVKKITTEAFLGIGFGSQVISSVSYYLQEYDTTGTYVNASTGESITEVNNYQTSYFYTINGKRLLVPLGINFSSNRARRISISVGLEACPGISFGYAYAGYYNLYKSELVLNDKSSYNKINSYSHSFGSIIDSKYEKQNIKGIGFTGYVSVPISLSLRASKRINFLKHILVTATASPGYYLTVNKITGRITNLVFMSALGIRYNLN